MMNALKQERRQRRRMRIRGKVTGTAERPRLTVYKSLRHLYAQIIDDGSGRTIASVTTNTKAAKASGQKSFANIATAKKLGVEIAAKAKSAGVESIVFDRNGYPYHGIIKAVADSAREAGLKF